jgi:hypothetical protein
LGLNSLKKGVITIADVKQTVDARRVQSHILEKVILVFMVLFGLAAIYILISVLSSGSSVNPIVAVVEILLILILAIFAQTYVLIKIYEQNLNK